MIFHENRMIRKYHNHKPQTTLWHREEEPLNHQETPGRQIKQSNQFSIPHQDDCFDCFDLILYVPSTIFQLNRDGSSWVEPVLS